LADALQMHGYRLAYAPLADGLGGWIRGQFHHTCDGAILVDPLPPDLQLLPSLGLPVVAVNELTDLDIIHVTPDEQQGIALAVAHLRDLGHQHIIFQRVPFNNRHPSAIAREQAAHAEAAKYGLTCESWVGVEAAEVVRRLQSGHRATALLCYCHVDALLMLHALSQAHMSVPGRVSVISVDQTFYTALSSPPLATLAVPTTAICVAAANELVAQIEGRSQSRRLHLEIAYQLIPDASCGPAPVS